MAGRDVRATRQRQAFPPSELVARVRAILKRSTPAATPRSLHRSALTLDPARHLCQVAGKPVALTPAEMALLARLMQHPDMVHPRGKLTGDVWAGEDISDRTLDSHLRNQRRKLQQAGCENAMETLHCTGMGLTITANLPGAHDARIFLLPTVAGTGFVLTFGQPTQP